MTKDSLMLFLKRILESGSPAKSVAALYQLREILELQNADPEFINLVRTAIDSIPEAKQAAMKVSFSEEDLKAAARRANERKNREMHDRSRCG